MQLFPMIRKASREHTNTYKYEDPLECEICPLHSAGIGKFESLARQIWGTRDNHLLLQGRGIHMLPGILFLLLIRADASLWRKTRCPCSCRPVRPANQSTI